MQKHLVGLMCFIPFFIVSCTNSKPDATLQAKLLTDSAINLTKASYSSESLQAALGLLDNAIAHDPTYYEAYWNKLMYQNQLGLRDDAFRTLNKLEELRPYSPDLKATCGIFLLLRQDSIGAMKKFEEADILFDNILDTIKADNDPYETYSINKAINLRFLNKEQEAQILFDSIYSRHDNPTLLAFINRLKQMSKGEMLHRFGVN